MADEVNEVLVLRGTLEGMWIQLLFKMEDI